MEHLSKCVLLVCLAGLAVSANVYPSGMGKKGEEKTKVAPLQLLAVNYAPDVATPIRYRAQNYDGPYDPLDPNGIVAARHRHMKIMSLEHAKVVKSYVPPGIDTVAKKEFKKVAVGEGRRFATSHPKETSELLGIAMKAKKLYQTASDKVKKTEAGMNQ